MFINFLGKKSKKIFVNPPPHSCISDASMPCIPAVTLHPIPSFGLSGSCHVGFRSIVAMCKETLQGPFFCHHLNWNVKVVADGIGIYFLNSFLNDFKRTKNAIERLLSGNDVSYFLPPTIPIKFLTENAFCQVFKTILQSVGWVYHLILDAHCNVFHPLTSSRYYFASRRKED